VPEPDVPEVLEPDVAGPDVAGPDVAEPDVPEPDGPEPDVAAPDPGALGAAVALLGLDRVRGRETGAPAPVSRASPAAGSVGTADRPFGDFEAGTA
jgi:hypothetical protein